MSTVIEPVSEDELETEEQSMFLGNEFREENEDVSLGMKHFSDD